MYTHAVLTQHTEPPPFAGVPDMGAYSGAAVPITPPWQSHAMPHHAGAPRRFHLSLMVLVVVAIFAHLTAPHPVFVSGSLTDAPGASPSHAETTRTAVRVVASSAYRYDAPPSISSAFFVDHMCSGGNKEVCAAAPDMYDIAVQQGYDPVWMLFHAMHETQYGSTGIGSPPANGHRATSGQDGFRGLFGLDCNSDADYCLDGVRFSGYDTYQQAARAQTHLLFGRGLYVDAGNTTVDAIIAIYCPPFNSNGQPECNTTAYIQTAKATVSAWRAQDSARTGH